VAGAHAPASSSYADTNHLLPGKHGICHYIQLSAHARLYRAQKIARWGLVPVTMNKEIANCLPLTEKAVKHHVNSIARKSKVRNRVEMFHRRIGIDVEPRAALRIMPKLKFCWGRTVDQLRVTACRPQTAGENTNIHVI